MQKKPFSQAGFSALQATLYALDDALLQAEADAVILNFKGWLYQHFELSPTQLNFLNEIDQRCIYFLEIQTSFALSHRLPITLSKEEEEEEDKTGKVIKPKSRFTVIASNNGTMLVEGNLEIQIYYQI